MNNKLKYSENKPTEVVIEDLASLKQLKDYREYFKDTDIATMKDLLSDIQSVPVQTALFSNSISARDVRYQIAILKDLITEQINAIASDEGTAIICDISDGIIGYIARILGYNRRNRANRATVDIENSAKVSPAATRLIENNLDYKYTKLIKYEKPIVGHHYTDPYLTLKFRYQDTAVMLCLIDYDSADYTTAIDNTIVLAYNINDTDWSKVSMPFEFGKSGGYKFELFIAALLGVEDEVLFSKQILTPSFLDY